jgi:hypothetical protein
MPGGAEITIEVEVVRYKVCKAGKKERRLRAPEVI